MKLFEVTDKTTIACGDCYRWAFKYTMYEDSEYTLVHANVTDMWSGKTYPHAWAENGTTVKDWQTMEAGSSKYAGKGWPQEDFYELFKPSDITKYKQENAAKLAAQSKHFGPWD